MHGLLLVTCNGHLIQPAEYQQIIFTARRNARIASAVLAIAFPTVCPSVRLSHAWFVTNPKNLPAIFLYHMKGQSCWFPDAKDLGEIPTGTPKGTPNRGGVG